MVIGVRQRLLMLLFLGLCLAVACAGLYRYTQEKRDILSHAKYQAEQAGRLLAELSVQPLLTADTVGLRHLAERFMQTYDVQEIVILDHSGRELVRQALPELDNNRFTVGPLRVVSAMTKLGDVRIAVYPADTQVRLKNAAQGVVFESVALLIVLAALLFLVLKRFFAPPARDIENTINEVLAGNEYSRRVDVLKQGEAAGLATGVNALIAGIERARAAQGVVAGKIAEIRPLIASDTGEIRLNSEAETAAIDRVSSSAAAMSTSIEAVAVSAQSLSSSAEETSSAILEMNASNQEVARHIGDLAATIEEVTSSVAGMISSIYEVAGHVDSLSSAADETSASALQIDATVREVEQAAKDSTKLSQQVSREARDIGVRSIQETKGAIDTIKTTVERYSDLVTRLGKRSEEIGKILGVIIEVTERTNLLALNASILAAQAGEHGRGFAVVAEEIKALAERTAGSTHDIAKLITAVQKETREAVAAMSDSLAAVNAGVERSREAGEALDKILASSSRSAEMATMIERAMVEQGRGIRQVSEAITNVKHMTLQMSDATQAQTKGSETIMVSAENMRDIARRVRISMDEQGRGGRQIAVAADNVTLRAGAIVAGTREQQQATNRILEALEAVKDLPRRTTGRMEEMAAALKGLSDLVARPDEKSE